MPTHLPAAEGGTSVRSEYLPLARPSIGVQEISAVQEVLDSGWLTTGARAQELGRRVASAAGASHGLAVNSCTAALHLSLVALGIGPGDEVITSTWTFCATVNVILHVGARPVIVDVEPDTLNLDPRRVEAAVTSRTRAIIPVHFAGHPAEMNPLLSLASRLGLSVIEDAAHAFGASYRGQPVGSLGEIGCFSFYANKNITTAEGGALVTANQELHDKATILSLHGMTRDAWKRYGREGSWRYDVTTAGFKYNLTDVAAAIGLVQLDRWSDFKQRRHELAERYDSHFGRLEAVEPLAIRPYVDHARHIYPILVDFGNLRIDRDRLIQALAAENIGTTVHFIPIHLHSYYREQLEFDPADLQVATERFGSVLSLPLFPDMLISDVDDVAEALTRIIRYYSG